MISDINFSIIGDRKALIFTTRPEEKIFVNELLSGSGRLKIAKTKYECQFDEIILRENLRRQNNKSINHDITVISFMGGDFSNFIKNYKTFVYDRVRESQIVQSVFYNTLTRIKIYLNPKLHMDMKEFQNKCEEILSRVPNVEEERLLI